MTGGAKILIFAYGSFADPTNISELVALKLKDTQFENAEIRVEILEVDYQYVESKFKEVTSEFEPDIIISLGENNYMGAQKFLEFELVAYNDEFKVDPNGSVPGELSGERRLVANDLMDIKTFGESLGFKTYDYRVEGGGKRASSKLDDGSAQGEMIIKVDNNAGRYLCEYIHYLSLEYTSGDAYFIHIADVIGADLEFDLIKEYQLKTVGDLELTDEEREFLDGKLNNLHQREDIVASYDSDAEEYTEVLRQAVDIVSENWIFQERQEFYSSNKNFINMVKDFNTSIFKS